MGRARHWIDRLFFVAGIVASITLSRLGFGLGLIAAVIAAIFLVWAGIVIYVTPGPKTKHFVEKLKGRSR